MTNTNTFFSSDEEEKDLGDVELDFNDSEEDVSFESENKIDDQLEDKKEENNDEEKSKEDKDTVCLSKTKIALIKKLLQNAKENNEKVVELLSVFSTDESDRAMISQMSDDAFSKEKESQEGNEEGNIVEGVFDGENMIGPDGKQYSIPANYASKSKLVEGDILKLTILNNGTFIYKQIGPIDRNRVVGELEKGASGQFIVSSDGKSWKVLTASVTYFKGNVGDEVVILVPKNADSQWAAVDNIVRKETY
ncbi:hypothetical protein C0584_04355 [Candidatus Parcubacteria bacterium]|nr:MAG: hypothetical protein C0584_04355 [Candidatus Parcubacteria bacterium]